MLSYLCVLICCLARAVELGVIQALGPGSFGGEEHDVNVNSEAIIVPLQWRWHHQGSAQTCCFPSFLCLCLRGLYLCETPLELCK